ncbi:MAG: tetratricopeptide repeat protein, partial [Planctomycetaceae bacterium]|nr:tetratricopeptide repeat protein [Planctomycetaceae bacterium]
MKTRFWITMLAATAAMMIASMDYAFGRGGGGRGGGGGGGRAGGGGGGNIGGGGGARPSVGSSPSYNRPSAPAARPSAPAARPNAGGASPGAGNRPSVQPGSRPAGAATPGSRPATQPSTRPSGGTGIGSGQGIGSGAGATNRPATGAAARPGVSQQPAKLPGLGAGAAAGAAVANRGAGVQDRAANRPQTTEDRRSSLNERMSSQGDRQENRQDFRNENREDWQSWANDAMENHGDFYHGSWEPGDSWNYMWDNYPVASALGVTAWGVNRVANGFGIWGYSNPYASSGGGGSYDYSEPLVQYAEPTAATDPNAAATASTQPAPTDEGMAAFEEARTAFYGGDYPTALTKLDTTLKTMPHDAVVHEFRSLVLFASKKYPESAAAIYAVLTAGPGWNWTTMSSLYPAVATYTEHLRALEAFAKANPKSADAHFLLGYHYQTAGHAESALKQFKLAQAELPDDKLIKQMVTMTSPRDASKQSETPPESPALPPEKVLKAEQLVGNWKSLSQGATFQLDLAKDGGFTWTYSRGKQKQSVKGVFAVDQNILALEVDDGSTMVAEIDLAKPTQFKFKM